MKPGNQWIYADTIYDSLGNLYRAYPDTVSMTNKTTIVNGIVFYGFYDSLGWFGKDAYVSNYLPGEQIIVIDSLTNSPYYFFTMPYSSNLSIDQKTYTDTTVNKCNQERSITGDSTKRYTDVFPGARNSDKLFDCKGNQLYGLDVYAAKGIGFTRIEYYKGRQIQNVWAVVPRFKQVLKKFVPK